MRLPELKITRTGLFILVVLFILTFSALWIRVLPLLTLNTDILNIVAMDDPMYNLRQTEQMLAHFPQYAWFEAMTLFPTGQAIPWGPLFIWLSSAMCIITGASTRSEIIEVSLWLPPILGALMVPAMFVLVRKAWDWKAGIFAAGLIAV
ncbi:MAG TPA: oligosaccharyl transferase, archaeosortase A system-associated, partial [Bacteroidales bacterium]|nr:oligosaccharyl transferase, archaeosortase A system-associated [Bacteroidales bacterium]